MCPELTRLRPQRRRDCHGVGQTRWAGRGFDAAARCAVGRAEGQRVVDTDRGVIGLIASAATLTVEKIELLLNPAYVPSCNLNPIRVVRFGDDDTASVGAGFPQLADRYRAFSVVTVTACVAITKVPLPRVLGRDDARDSGGAGFVHWL